MTHGEGTRNVTDLRLTPWERRQLQMRNAAAHVLVPDFQRAGGDCVCPTCGYLYVEHPEAVPYPWLRLLCNGKYVKL